MFFYEIRTYVGSTNNLNRRLKQHNGKLSGGAKCTKSFRNWGYKIIFYPFKNRSIACSFEQKLRNRYKRYPKGWKSRLQSGIDVINLFDTNNEFSNIRYDVYTPLENDQIKHFYHYLSSNDNKIIE